MAAIGTDVNTGRWTSRYSVPTTMARKVVPNTCDTLGTCSPDRHAHSGLCAQHCNQQSVCWAERNAHDTVAQKILADYAAWLGQLARS